MRERRRKNAPSRTRAIGMRSEPFGTKITDAPASKVAAGNLRSPTLQESSEFPQVADNDKRRGRLEGPSNTGASVIFVPKGPHWLLNHR